MQLPLQIVFRNVAPSAAVEARIRERAAALERFADRIMSCRVAVELQHRHHHQGNLYRVRVDLKVPDGELVASRAPGEDHAHEDVYVAIRDAFDALRRQLEDHTRRRRGAVKTHVVPPHGRVVERHGDYGRIETPEGRLVYFHRNSVIGTDFERLAVGAEVRFTEEMGERGPQASTVQPLGKHHLLG